MPLEEHLDHSDESLAAEGSPLELYRTPSLLLPTRFHLLILHYNALESFRSDEFLEKSDEIHTMVLLILSLSVGQNAVEEALGEVEKDFCMLERLFDTLLEGNSV